MRCLEILYCFWQIYKISSKSWIWIDNNFGPGVYNLTRVQSMVTFEWDCQCNYFSYISRKSQTISNSIKMQLHAIPSWLLWILINERSRFERESIFHLSSVDKNGSINAIYWTIFRYDLIKKNMGKPPEKGPFYHFISNLGSIFDIKW